MGRGVLLGVGFPSAGVGWMLGHHAVSRAPTLPQGLPPGPLPGRRRRSDPDPPGEDGKEGGQRHIQARRESADAVEAQIVQPALHRADVALADVSAHCLLQRTTDVNQTIGTLLCSRILGKECAER